MPIVKVKIKVLLIFCRLYRFFCIFKTYYNVLKWFKTSLISFPLCPLVSNIPWSMSTYTHIQFLLHLKFPSFENAKDCMKICNTLSLNCFPLPLHLSQWRQEVPWFLESDPVIVTSEEILFVCWHCCTLKRVQIFTATTCQEIQFFIPSKSHMYICSQAPIFKCSVLVDFIIN